MRELIVCLLVFLPRQQVIFNELFSEQVFMTILKTVLVLTACLCDQVPCTWYKEQDLMLDLEISGITIFNLVEVGSHMQLAVVLQRSLVQNCESHFCMQEFKLSKIRILEINQFNTGNEVLRTVPFTTISLYEILLF